MVSKQNNFCVGKGEGAIIRLGTPGEHNTVFEI